MKPITVKTRGKSLYLRFMVKGTSFYKTWGQANNPHHVAKMTYIASLISADLSTGAFTDIDAYFETNKIWTWEALVEAIDAKAHNQSNELIIKRLASQKPHVSGPTGVKKFLDSFNCSATSKNRYLAVIKSVAPEICKGITYSSKCMSGPNPFTKSQQHCILSAVDETRLLRGFLLRMWLHCGFRPGEARALAWGDISLSSTSCTITKSMTPSGLIKQPKNGLSRSIPLTDELMEEIDRVYAGYKPDDIVFPEIRHHASWSTRKWHAFLKECGITDDIRPYRLRHTAISNAVSDNPHQIAKIAKQYGTSTKMIFQHYLGDIHL